MNMRATHEIRGGIFDVDDTILDNCPTRVPLENLHQVSRLEALHRVGREFGHDALLLVEAQENYDAFTQSPVHTVAGAMWTVMRNRGVLGNEFDPAHPLILQAVEYKNMSYGQMLTEHCNEIEGASDFVHALAATYGIEDKLAIASTAVRRDINTFTETMGLRHYFPDERVFDVNSITHPKPHHEVFDKAFVSLGLPDSSRRSVYAFEDDPRGMLSARRAGLTVCAITTRYDRAFLEQVEAKPEIIVDSFEELGNKLKLNGY